MLRQALAMGVDRVVLVESAETLRPLGVAKLLRLGDIALQRGKCTRHSGHNSGPVGAGERQNPFRHPTTLPARSVSGSHGRLRVSAMIGT